MKFVKEGATVVLASRNPENLNDVAEDIQIGRGKCLAVQTDVSKEEDCRKLIENTIQYFGKIDVLINNAGVSMRALFAETELEVLRKLMDINFWGTVYCTKYALPHIIKQKGTIAGISSIAGFKGLPGRIGYSASKFAMHGFLETLRIENRKNGLNVLLVAPGFTNTNIRNTALTGNGSIQSETPLEESKLMSSTEVAEHIYNGILKRKREIILTAQGKLVVFLNKFIPSIIDKMVYNHFAGEKNSPLKK